MKHKKKSRNIRDHAIHAADNPHVLNLLQQALDCQQSGNLDQADGIYRQLLEQHPRNSEALHLYGLLQHQKGNHESAIKLMKRAIRINDNDPMYYNNLGIVYKVTGKTDEARFAFEKAVRLDKNLADAFNNLGSLYQEQGKLPEARAACERALKINPRHMMACANLGIVCLLQGEYEKARELNMQALALDPDFATAHINLGIIYQAEENFELARTHYERALKVDPHQLEAYTNLANIYLLQENFDKAREINNKALAMDPDFATAHTNLGIICQAEGNFELAKIHYERAVKSDPCQADAWFGLATLKHAPVDAMNLAARMEKLLTNKNINERKRSRLHFALGKLKEGMASYDEAFAHYQAGNEIKHTASAYNKKSHEQSVTEQIEYFTRERIQKLSAIGSESLLPVFIVGMPRSGTTLIEQIISSHPHAAAAGEQVYFSNAVKKLPSLLHSSHRFPACLEELDQAAANGMCAEYLQQLRKYSTDALCITDKMPANFLHLGLINILFPRAHVIHCARNPVDTCLSVYFQDFISAVPYAWDLEEIGHYYCQYERIMAHWMETLTLPVMDIVYEDLINNPEAISRKLIEFTGLEWDEQCLAFHQGRRTVRTASNWQVRQPVYTSSVNRSGHYLKHIMPLLKALDEYKTEYKSV